MRAIFTCISLFTCTLFFIACNDQQDRELVYCNEGPVALLNPALTNSLTSSKTVHRNLYDQLVEFDTQGKIVPGLAWHWNSSSDGLTYTFYLRSNAYFQPSLNGFQPTRNFDARDVLYTFSRYRDANHPLHSTPASNGGLFSYWQFKKMDQLLKSVDLVNPWTIRFVLHRADAEFLETMATAAFSIFSEEYGKYVVAQNEKYLQEHAGETIDPKALPINWYDTQPIGTGPYRLEKFENGSVKLSAMSSHFQGNPIIKHITFLPVTDSQARASKVVSGACHIAADPVVGDYIQLQQSHPDILQFQSQHAMNIGFLTMSELNLPDPRIRRAISMALDRPAYVQAIYQGYARVAGSLIDRSLLGNFVVPEVYTYLPDRARDLLNQAGATGRTFTLLYMPISRPYNPEGKRLALLMQQDLEAVGLKIRLATVGFDTSLPNKPLTVIYDDTPSNVRPDFTAYVSYVTKGLHEIAQLGDNPLMPSARDRYLNSIRAGIAIGNGAGTNYSHWSNDEFERIYDEIGTTHDANTLQELYTAGEQILADQVPYAPILNGDIFRIARKEISGYELHPLHTERLQFVRFNK